MDRKPSFALFFILLLISPYPILAAAVEKETARKRDKRVAFALSLGAIAAIPWLKAGLVAASGAVALAVAARASARVTRVSDSDSHSCASNRGWCRRWCFSHEYVDHYHSDVCGSYSCCRPR